MGQWMSEMAHFFMQYGVFGLFVLSFVEASFFPVPPYLLSIPMTLAAPKLGFFYALVGTVGSVLGGLLGYAIGAKLGRPILMKFIKPASLRKVETLYTRYGDWATAAGGVTPLPYKIFAISAGVFRNRLATFIPASICARGIRFFGEAFLLIVFGQKVLKFLESAFGPVNLIILVVIAGFLIMVWRAGWIPGKLVLMWRGIRDHWFAWVNQVRQRFLPAGVFSWYLLTGATLAAFGFIVFAKLSSELLEKELTRFDTVIGKWIFSFRFSFLTSVMRAITSLGSTGWIIGFMAVIILIGFRFRKRLEVLAYSIAVLGALGLSELLKRTFHRTRPPLPWLAHASGYSFPSGHSLISLTVYGFLAYLAFKNIKLLWLRYLSVGILILLPVLIGISRIYLGVHFPSDVIGGWAVGVFWIGTCVTGLELLNSRLSRIR
ncbi:MAG TPA: phosphatase PAP2 family protein [Bacillota bacterium]|nr:phosphatase PAP2 family protein [Bacillota bacterium]